MDLDKIIIGSGQRIESGMRRFSHFVQMVNINVLRKKSVNPMKKISGNFLSHIKMCEHLPGVDARIGSAGAGERNGLTKHCGESFFHYLLYADVFRLPLPTVILLAVICKFQKIPHECPVSGLNFINAQFREYSDCPSVISRFNKYPATI